MYNSGEHYDFSVSSTADESILAKMQHDTELKNLLNSNLSIKDYSDTVTGIFMIYQSLNTDFAKAFPVEEKTIFRRKTKEIEIYTVIDYKTVVEASDTEMLKILAQTYLRGIKQFIKRKDFDIDCFYKDVEKLFEVFV